MLGNAQQSERAPAKILIVIKVSSLTPSAFSIRLPHLSYLQHSFNHLCFADRVGLFSLAQFRSGKHAFGPRGLSHQAPGCAVSDSLLQTSARWDLSTLLFWIDSTHSLFAEGINPSIVPPSSPKHLRLHNVHFNHDHYHATALCYFAGSRRDYIFGRWRRWRRPYKLSTLVLRCPGLRRRLYQLMVSRFFLS